MIFSCSKCGTRHQLPDEQVAHRVLKVRCTGCSAIVIVRDPASLPPAASAWFVAVHGQQRGPLSQDEVVALAAQGGVSGKTYVWRAGMAEWTKAEELPELADLFASAAAHHGTEGEAARQAAARQAAARQAAEAKAALSAEVEAARQAAEAEAALSAEVEAARQAAAVEAALSAEVEAARQAAAAEAALSAEVEAARQSAAVEAALSAEVEAARQGAEAEAALQAAAELEALRQEEAEFEALLQEEAEEAARAAEAEAARQAEVRAQADEAERQAAALRVDADERRAAIAGALERAARRPAPIESPPAESANEAVPPPIPGMPPIPSMPPIPGVPSRLAIAAPEPVRERRDLRTTAVVPFDTGPSEPTGLAGLVTGDAELAFFQNHPSEPQALAGDDIFAAVDQPTADDKEFFKRAMKEAPAAPFKDRKPSRIEMDSLRQEFSVVAHLERTKKKSWVYGAVGVGAVAALVVGILVFQQQQRESSAQDAAGRRDDGAGQVYAERKLYATPPRELPEIAVVEPDAVVGTVQPEAVGGAVKPVASKVHATHTSPGSAHQAPEGDTVVRHTTFVASHDALKQDDGSARLRSLTPAQFKALTQDDLGKGETKVDFDARAVQDAAAKDAAAQHEAFENERAAAVADTFGKKRRLFAACAGDAQERVKVVFTVLPTGNVSEVTIGNTKSEAKADCLEKILGRSIFPKGASIQTYSQTLVL